MIAAIITAAGRSSRMGRPKATLPFRGSTFLGVVIDACRGDGLSPIVVAVGDDCDKLLSGNSLSDIEIVHNLDADLGPIGSIAAGIGILNRSVDAAVVWPVDQPHVRQATLSALVAAFERSRDSVVVPTFGGAGGHPVLLPRAVFPLCLAAARDRSTLRDVLRTNADRVVRLPVEDAAVINDIDTPSDYESLLEESDKSL